MAYRSKLKPCKIKSRAKAFIDKLSLRSIADLFHVNKNPNCYLAYLAGLRAEGGLKAFRRWSVLLAEGMLSSKYRGKTAIFKNPSTLW